MQNAAGRQTNRGVSALLLSGPALQLAPTLHHEYQMSFESALSRAVQAAGSLASHHSRGPNRSTSPAPNASIFTESKYSKPRILSLGFKCENTARASLSLSLHLCLQNRTTWHVTCAHR